jgi:hypothetical protein
MEVLVVEDRLELTAATIGGYIIFGHRHGLLLTLMLGVTP